MFMALPCGMNSRGDGWAPPLQSPTPLLLSGLADGLTRQPLPGGMGKVSVVQAPAAWAGRGGESP